LMFWNPISHVNKVETPNFKRMQKIGFINPAYRKAPLDEFIAYYIKGRTKDVSGPGWEEVFAKVAAHEKGRTPPEWREYTRAKPSRFSRELFFGPDQEPFAGLNLAKNRALFLRLAEGGRTLYLRMDSLAAYRADNARSSLLYPWRDWSWIPLALGLVLYLFVLPKVVRPEGTMGFTRLWGMMVTDLFGLVFAAGLFFVGFFAMVTNGVNLANLFSLEAGPLSGVLILWALGVLALSPMWFGISYRNFWISLTPEGLKHHTWRGERFYAFRDMAQAGFRIKQPGKLAKLILTLGAGFGGPGGVGMAATAMGNKQAFMVINIKDGKDWWIRLQGFDNGVDLAQALKDHGVPLDDKLSAALEKAGSE
jgi:hypothetical protein